MKKFKEYKNLDLTNVANEVSEFWKENDTFKKSVEIREGQPEFVFYEGPPSANGMPGIHHVMARAIKDIFCRFQTQKGKKVFRKAGWDTHGPVSYTHLDVYKRQIMELPYTSFGPSSACVTA